MQHGRILMALGFVMMAQGTAAQELETCSTLPDDARSLRCMCPAGMPDGSVWGSGPYTADSAICAAGMHAGVIGQAGGEVIVIRRPGQDAYDGSDANGVTTSSWGPYQSSIDVRRTKNTPDATPIDAGAAENAADADDFRCASFPDDQTFHYCTCPSGFALGDVWGADPFTDDSDICTAAKLLGYIDDTGGEIRAIAIPGLLKYGSASANGVETQDWSGHDRSFVFDWNHD